MQGAFEVTARRQHRGGGEGGHIQVSHREGHPALHLFGGSLVRGLEALHVQAQHWGQLPDGHLLHCCSLTLAPARDIRKGLYLGVVKLGMSLVAAQEIAHVGTCKRHLLASVPWCNQVVRHLTVSGHRLYERLT